MLNIRLADTNDIPEIQRLSDEIWKKVYISIISMEQLEYMLNWIYSDGSLRQQINGLQHQFILVQWDGINVGYASYSIKSAEEPHRFRLHKLYVQPEIHGKGLGKSMISFIIGQILPLGAQELELNVNKQNSAIQFYQRLGFTIESDVTIDIGHGFVMDDHVMVLDLIKNPL